MLGARVLKVSYERGTPVGEYNRGTSLIRNWAPWLPRDAEVLGRVALSRSSSLSLRRVCVRERDNRLRALGEGFRHSV